jgi:hypothetical protein
MGGMGLKVGIYGGSGYAGIELVRLLSGHPEVGATTRSSPSMEPMLRRRRSKPPTWTWPSLPTGTARAPARSRSC